jgi:sugar phosphate isomerase/epimerase
MPTDAANPAVACTPVLISLTAFGASEVRRQGQPWFTRLCHEAGADGVEVRSELLVDAASELPAIAQAVGGTGMQLVYSSADPLWTPDGLLNASALEHALQAATLLGAPRLKMAIGGFSPSSAASLVALKAQLQHGTAELVIENDQTAQAGSLLALQDFFSAAHERGVALGMTFDMGNWHWTGECPLQAASALAPQVRYVHCKGVQRQPQRWVAVPLAESSAPWRAVLRALPAHVPWAIEYPLAGDDLLAVTRREVSQLRSLASGMASRPSLTY